MKKARSGNVYDRIFKENAESLFITLIEQELDIKIKSYTPLQEKMTKTVEREMDFFYHTLTENGDEFLLHIEFQTQDDREMIYRMSEYHGLSLNKYKLPIKHVVIYLGQGTPIMRTHLDEDEVFTGFELINIYSLDTTHLLTSQIPEVVLLAILSNYEKERTEAVLRLIITQLKAVCKSKTALSKYLTQLIILSRLRKLEELTSKIIQNMPITYDIQQDSLYKEGLSIGIEKGIEQGIKQNIEQVVIRCLQKSMDIEEICSITGSSEIQVQQIKAKMESGL